MAADVVMPQMGESITEGTIVRWLKRVGDAVDRDEPLFEISTDKVEAEIPAPSAGILLEICVTEGDTVPVDTVVARIGTADEQRATGHGGVAAASPVPDADAPAADPGGSPRSAAPSGTVDERRRQRSSPLVRRMAREHRVDISQLRGTGIAGRVTKRDLLTHLERPSAAPSRRSTPRSSDTGAGLAGQTLPMSVMRRKIAEHMVLSKRTSAHVHTVFQVNYHRVSQIRDGRKAEFAARGGKLTYLSFILKAVVDALRAVPAVNASVDAEMNVTYHREVNLGVAVALDWGLIVPVVRHADTKGLFELSTAVADLATRARAKQLEPDEVAGGTFTVTNPGGIGAQFGLPIINQPQIAILGVGAIEPRVVVVDDAIAIRPMGYLSLAFDHRVIDGAVGDQFMAIIKQRLEQWDPADV